MSVMEMAFRATLPFGMVGLGILMIPLTFVLAKLVSEMIMDNGSYMKVKNKKVKSSSEEIDLYKYYSPVSENKENNNKQRSSSSSSSSDTSSMLLGTAVGVAVSSSYYSDSSSSSSYDSSSSCSHDSGSSFDCGGW
ncbi:TPA: hypothetical protein ROY23_005781 [Bacillus wiedmannii]|nr:hypothetical protein [Bacillus wiedmannii]